MTKNEAMDSGRRNGQIVGEFYCNDESRLRLLRNDVISQAFIYASDSASRPSRHDQQVIYDRAFVDSFMLVWDNRYNDLPDVKAASRLRHITHKLEQLEQFAQSRIADFAKKLTADTWDAAANAFEWGQDALEAAGKLRATRRAKAWLEQAGLDGLEKQLTGSVIFGAKYPEHSTSQISNLTKQAELAGYAELLSIVRGDL